MNMYHLNGFDDSSSQHIYVSIPTILLVSGNKQQLTDVTENRKKKKEYWFLIKFFSIVDFYSNNVLSKLFRLKIVFKW